MSTAAGPSPPSTRRRTLVAGGLLLPENGGAAHHADLLIEAGAIIAILSPHESRPEDAAIIEAEGCALIPGLVNAHTHGHGGLSKGVGDRWSLELLLNAAGWIGGGRSDEDRYLSTLLTAIELLQKGCTACFDLSLAVPLPTAEALAATARAYLDAGMRAVIAPMIGDIPFYRAVPGLIEAAPAALRRDMERAAASDGATVVTALARIAASWSFPADRVRLGIAPTIPLHSTDAFLVGCHRVARDHGLRFQTHLAESKVQAIAAQSRYGHSITAHLAGLDILDECFSGAHGIWLDDHCIGLLADHGASIAHNPGSNLRLGSGIADARALLARGVNLGIGTDGGASADGQNMFEATRLACNLSRVHGRAPDEWLSAAETLRLVTIGGAKLIGFEGEIGRIAPGYKADLILLDLSHINYTPLNNLTHQVVHVEDGSAVDRVMVGGKIVVDRGRVLGIDMQKVARQAGEAAERLANANAEARAQAERLAPHVARFCHALACGCGSASGTRQRRLENAS